jgi:Holliday junction resolvase-like predicted endonuclease
LKTVEYFCKRNKVDFEQIRFDVITVTKWDTSFQLKHYRNIEI